MPSPEPMDSSPIPDGGTDEAGQTDVKEDPPIVKKELLEEETDSGDTKMTDAESPESTTSKVPANTSQTATSNSPTNLLKRPFVAMDTTAVKKELGLSNSRKERMEVKIRPLSYSDWEAQQSLVLVLILDFAVWLLFLAFDGSSGNILFLRDHNLHSSGKSH